MRDRRARAETLLRELGSLETQLVEAAALDRREGAGLAEASLLGRLGEYVEGLRPRLIEIQLAKDAQGLPPPGLPPEVAGQISAMAALCSSPPPRGKAVAKLARRYGSTARLLLG
jgi:hypothetical protein